MIYSMNKIVGGGGGGVGGGVGGEGTKCNGLI